MKHKSPKGFTLIELLVVISIIAILMAILMPALAKVREQAKTVFCSSNVRSLGQAWYAYADSNGGKLVGARTDTVDKPNFSWVERPQDEAGASRDAEIEDEKRGIQKGLLWPYTGELKVYNCPGDKRAKRSGANEAYRSYSINYYMNGANGNSNNALRITGIRRPADKFTFIEEHENRGYNVGAWELSDDRNSCLWTDPVAIVHGGKTVMAFADGHADTRKWDSRKLVEAMEPQPHDLTLSEAKKDYDWIFKAYMPRR